MAAFIEEPEHFPTTLAKDLKGLLLGNLLGAGTHRAIYEHAKDPSLIVKIENGYQCFNNVKEWEAWRAVQFTSLARWFAPCVDISGAGTILIMKRCKPIPVKRLPAQVPAFFTDLKAENWGLYQGRPVCLDYGLHLLHENGMTKRMRKVNWG